MGDEGQEEDDEREESVVLKEETEILSKAIGGFGKGDGDAERRWV